MRRRPPKELQIRPRPHIYNSSRTNEANYFRPHFCIIFQLVSPVYNKQFENDKNELVLRLCMCEINVPLVLGGLVQYLLCLWPVAALPMLFVFMAESHKTFQAIIFDILFPCGDQAQRFVVSKETFMRARWEHKCEQDRGNGTIMLQKKKQF